MLTFNTENMELQNFPFKPPLMDYIFKNAKPEHLIKFYQTCKFFYNKFRRNIILNLEIADYDEAEVLDPTKTIICGSNPNLQKLADFWITDSLIVRYFMIDNYIPLFTQCVIKKLELCECLSWDDYVVLTKAGTVEDLKVEVIVSVPNGNMSFAPIEAIISQVPNATSIEISGNFITAKTFAALVSLDRKAKLSKFVLKDIGFPYINRITESYSDFLSENVDADCNILIDFKLLPEFNDHDRERNGLMKELEKQFGEAAALVLQKIKMLKEVALADN
uniref:F-box domain-containing protein n=1 Tax=Panagrolaimus sp. ES5 TaxID=591445 RepID=A0AC34F9R7_9BILA